MKKKILLPTDFSIESLNLLKSILSQNNDGWKYDIVLLHGVTLTSSISELLFFSKASLIQSLTNTDFEDACNVLKNKYASHINSIRKDIFTGFTQTSFNNYVEANRFDMACIPASYKLQIKSSKSFDVVPFIKKSKLKTEQIEWNMETLMPEKGRLAELFFRGVATN
ncbi:MAG TPA: hypothetical protein PKC39_04360 [Ferruginibacter sp.]|nr:hypothetical protein [Ferruginibacter sp.]HMP20172.1 hypothetical protein [Ferruginibacter sp.]